MKKPIQPIRQAPLSQIRDKQGKQVGGKHFYTHIVETDSLVVELDEMTLSKGEKDHLIALIDSNVHHAILDAILSELSLEDKKQFLHILSKENHDDIWKFLQTKVTDIEGKIKKAALELKKELHEDIKEAKKKK